MSKFWLSLLVLFTLWFVHGCGQTGDLYLPSAEDAEQDDADKGE